MGQLFSSSPYTYDPPDDSSPHTPDVIPMSYTIGSGDRAPDGEAFYVDFNDPESLVRELERYHMVGVLISPLEEFPVADVPMGDLYLIGWDDMPTSLVNNEAVFISAVYPASLSHLATLFVGGEALREKVRGHRSFVSDEMERYGGGVGVEEHADEGQIRAASKRVPYRPLDT
ncbi:hypothetical protein TWF481_004878 [Arthrobotrys musiformis]|uniref:Uncharacterized protein n=1 Tax=Arthrobotrys musiformis TaxID=47236 RepID=A0AAV9WM05_9PEZI